MKRNLVKFLFSISAFSFVIFCVFSGCSVYPINGSVVVGEKFVVKGEAGVEVTIRSTNKSFTNSFFIPLKNHEVKILEVGEKAVFTTETSNPIFLVYQVEASSYFKDSNDYHCFYIHPSKRGTFTFVDKIGTFKIGDQVGL